ncbi:protein-methionine-sulfoxide reductase heme-binding subunit MsrQ [Ferrimonas balearica]|uniref:protein-methionine-sulfoxide reductase heme-binding subunit MsrQ n=1 Tax=Ferrimonas balearica TaxID=44012 RepID=UPI001C995E7A|nr:protein-methionine-sulfoxide reductase heme-binding subunit MsrQ [Ferrimonas balearica]MBY5920925.1 protein-methionine-sulfoxide reductase heme-binding subunit MsrQ [Ferrimonas balearica]MBY5996390.1 protein-methionine-sulfoxide reductase heme-binding subunit MsrQ [Ferrimonas balearica]
MGRRQMFALKATLHLSCALPLLYLYLAVVSGAAGGDPVQYIIHFLGMGILNTLAATLLVSPLARWRRWPWLIRVRRLLGLWCFTYALLHLSAFLVFDLLMDWSLLLTEIVKRPYIMVGMAGFLILLALAVTSPKAVQRRVGRHWQRLHRWVYLVAVLGPIHFWWSVKSGNWEPALYLSGFLLLLALRRRGIWPKWTFRRLGADSKG